MDVLSDPSNPRRVLIVDDNAINRLVARRYCTQMGLDVTEAVDGVSALAQFEHTPFDVVLLDLRMPGLSGVDVCRQLRESHHGHGRVLVIVAYTAHPRGHDIPELIAKGFDAVILKPAGLEAFRRVLAPLLAQKR